MGRDTNGDRERTGPQYVEKRRSVCVTTRGRGT